MIFSVASNPRYYSSDCCLSSATRKRYVLEEYPSRVRNTPEFNRVYDAFRPITPPPHFNQQFHDPRESVYDKPCAHYFDNEQQQQQQQRNLSTTNRINSFRRNAGKRAVSYHKVFYQARKRASYVIFFR
jgi:hypothetical protein